MPQTHRDELTAEELETWASVATLLERLPAALDAQLQRDSGLTHFEQGILYALAHAPERRLRLSVLASYASCTLSRLSRAVSRLEKQGWVHREIDPEDGRFTLGVLTDTGLAKVDASTPAHHAFVRSLIFDTLTGDEAHRLGELSARVAAAISSESAWTGSRWLADVDQVHGAGGVGDAGGQRRVGREHA